MSEYRRKLKELERAASSPAPQQEIKTQLSPKREQREISSPNQASQYDKMIAEYTIEDLKRTFLITFLILALEFFVFYAKLKGVIKIF